MSLYEHLSLALTHTHRFFQSVVFSKTELVLENARWVVDKQRKRKEVRGDAGIYGAIERGIIGRSAVKK